MEEPRHYLENPQFPFPRPRSDLRRNRTNRGKSFARFLCKVCFFALVIVLVPLFPSQAPEFISESVVTKFWELIHLLFVGIAVSYGLFCRRNDEVEIGVGSDFDSLEHDMSRMFHLSSRSEEGHENLCGFDGKRVVQDLSVNPDVSLGEGGVESGAVQAWNSQYSRGGSMVVVARPNCGFGEFGEPGSEIDYKPLGLPVRSLKSRIRKREKRGRSELVSANESGSGSFGSIKSFDENSVEKIGNSGPMYLENSFDEAFASPSPVPWHSRSVRTEMKEKHSRVSRPAHFRPLSADETQFDSVHFRPLSVDETQFKSAHFRPLSVDETQFESAHFRPLSVDETQFESLGAMGTPSLRSTVSFSSRASSASSSQGDDSPLHYAASEVTNSKVEDEGKETSFRSSYFSSGSPSPPKPIIKHEMRKAKSFQGSLASVSPSPPQPIMDDKASTAMGRSSFSSSFYEDELRAPKDYSNGLSESRRDDDVSDSKESGASSLISDVKKNFSFRRALSRGKSVRTIRPSRLTTKPENCGDVQGNKAADHDAETEFLGKETMGNAEQSFDCSSPEPKNMIGDDQTGEIQEFADDASAKTEEVGEIEAKELRLSTSEYTDSESVHGSRTPDSSEVDKKAGEFIAKFREQIRLQKVASMERSRGLRFGANNFR